MMYAYKRAGSYHAVIELKEYKEVFVSSDGKEVKKKAHFLNSGGGFAGDTPDFFHKVVAKAA